MKSRPVIGIATLFLVMLTACNSPLSNNPTPTQSSEIIDTQTTISQPSATPSVQSTETVLPPEAATTTPEIFNPLPIEGLIGEKAREDLSLRLGLDLASISVVRITSQDWPDTYLGLAPAVNQECTKTSVHGWQIVLNASGHTHGYRATADGSLISYSGPVGINGPEACMISGTSLIYSPEDGYCFAYPVRFHRNDEHGPIGIYGPACGPGPEPLYAALTVSISTLPGGQTLESAVETFLAQLGNLPMPQTHQSLSVASEPAVVLEVVPEMVGSRDVFIAHHGRLFHLTFWPAPSVVSETATDVEDLYQTVISSFTFQP